MSKGRLEAFTDVLAIAATLLILNVDTQVGPGVPDLGSRLVEIWPSYVGNVVSFITIGIIWANNHTLLSQIGRVDRLFLMLNVLLLLCVAFIPFPTRLVTEYFGTDNARAATILYGVTLTSVAVVFNAMWFYASIGGRLLREDSDPQVVKGITRSYLPAPWIYLVITLVGIVNPTASVIGFGGFALFWVIESSVLGRTRQRT